jgi:hypothetical protein
VRLGEAEMYSKHVRTGRGVGREWGGGNIARENPPSHLNSKFFAGNINILLQKHFMKNSIKLTIFVRCFYRNMCKTNILHLAFRAK